MAISYNKKELEKQKQNKRQEKQKRKEERKANGGSGAFEDMIAYVDENGRITSTPPNPDKKVEVEVDDIVISTPKKTEADEVDPVLRGRVEYFSREKRFGFIKEANSVEKFFFHINNAPANITEGNQVTFELERTQKGMNAVRITLVK